jgi:hypothetical protein
MTHISAALLTLASLFVAGCASERRATESDCETNLDRIVEIELVEMGFEDPVLAERRRADIGAKLRGEIRECVGRPLSTGALECLARARTTEEVSHTCLR